MLTLARPTSKVDEDIFSKWVFLSIIIIIINMMIVVNVMLTKIILIVMMARLVELDKPRLVTDEYKCLS